MIEKNKRKFEEQKFSHYLEEGEERADNNRTDIKVIK